ncbi:MAG: hypothetical protein ABL901_11650 [Hyphomicrobiaceae bacterium]
MTGAKFDDTITLVRLLDEGQSHHAYRMQLRRMAEGGHAGIA